MSTVRIPFRLPGFRIIETHTSSPTTLVVTAHARSRRARCPRCHQPSHRVHSYYVRSPADLPLGELAVQLHLRVRRFRCLATPCPQRTFAERLPSVVPVAARRTTRLTTTLQSLAFATGGEAGARLSHTLHISVSPDTLLRIMRNAPSPNTPSPRVLGVDDFALRKGAAYGTLLVDLEQQRRIDLLPDRSAATLRDWLRQHPGTEVIARDRSTEYARGATEGAPEAVQVADRWHLLHNLREVLERLLHRRYSFLQTLPPANPQARVTSSDGGGGARHTSLRLPSASERAASATARERRLAQYHAVRTLHTEGKPILSIARRLGMSRVTVRKYIQADTFPERSLPPPPASMLDPYRPYLQRRWGEGCANAAQLWRELQGQGYRGARKQVERWAYHRRTDVAPTTPQRYRPGLSARRRAQDARLPSPRRLSWLVLRCAETLTADEVSALACIRQDQEIALGDELAHQFQRMIRQKTPDALDGWLAACAISTVGEFETFAAGLRQDYAAVHAALREPWSTGPVEGHVNRVKLVKRQMFGRANFDLLRKRVLHAA